MEVSELCRNVMDNIPLIKRNASAGIRPGCRNCQWECHWANTSRLLSMGKSEGNYTLKAYHRVELVSGKSLVETSERNVCMNVWSTQSSPPLNSKRNESAPRHFTSEAVRIE